MATCTFLGHREIYDLNLDRSIRSAVARVIADGEVVEFLFHANSEFYNHCLAVVLEAKHRYLQRVSLSLLLTEEKTVSGQIFPLCLFDKVIRLKSTNESDASATLWSRILDSQYVVSYLYGRLCENEEQQLAAIRNCPSIIEIDLTQKDTAAFIQKSAEQAEEKSNLMLQQIGRELETEPSIAEPAIPDDDNRDCQKQESLLLQRLCRERIAHRPVFPTACAIMLSGPIRDLELFQSVIHFIINAFGVSVFGVGKIHCFNQYAMKLSQIIRSYNNVQMTAYISVDTPSQNHESDLQSIYAPMYSSVINTEVKARTMKGRIVQTDLELLRRSEYVIYDSNKDPELNEITQRKIDRFKRKLKVIDLGNAPYVESPEI